MKRLIHFFSLAVMTQAILMLSQLILLPIQVRLWGQSATATWYSALALATITYVVDCGLRTAGHAELIQASIGTFDCPPETAQFRQIWSWIRILVLLVTGALIAGDLAVHLILHHGAYPVWRIALILACALETVLIIRITYLDSLGRYRGAEASYFAFASLRLIASVPALLILHWNATGLAGIYLATAGAGLFAQGHWLCKSNPLLRLTDKFPALSWKALTLARYTVAEPIANWVRLSLPVLVIGQIASPIAVTTYVALRAVFGAGRTTIQQLARVASVEVLKSRTQGQLKRADSLLTVFVFVAIVFGSAVGMSVLIDNMRVLGLWLRNFDRELFQQIALAFALTAPFFSYQIPMNLMFRTGELAPVAHRHYLFIVSSALFASVSMLSKSWYLYLAFLVLGEMILSVSFFATPRTKTFLSEGNSGTAGLKIAFCCSFTIALVWSVVRKNIGDCFVDLTLRPVAESLILLVAIASVLIGALYSAYGLSLTVLRRAKVVASP